MSTVDRVRELILPILADISVDLYDLEQQGPTLRVTIEQEGGLDVDTLTLATRLISRALDDADIVASTYTLEVSSPGLERPLRTPAHLIGAIGSEVSVKTTPAYDGPRRLSGQLLAADDDGILLLEETGAERRVTHGEIHKANTVFVWGPAEHPQKQQRSSQKART